MATQSGVPSYGVWKGHPVDRRLATSANPHYQVKVVDNTTDYRIAINVQSAVKSKSITSESGVALSVTDLSIVEYLIDDHFKHSITTGLPDLQPGFTLLEKKPGGLALDFIRGNLFNRDNMKPLPFNLPGPDNDLNEMLDKYIQRAMADEAAFVYAFGSRWGPEPQLKDKIFGFLPGNGIHDIHMNQGNPPGEYEKDNSVYSDGGLLIYLAAEQRWVAIFLKFQTQSWHTDDINGNQIPSTTPAPAPGEADFVVQIIAALVNPVGPAPEKETVTLLNTSPQPIKLDGWALLNTLKQRHPLSGTLPAGSTQVVTLSPQVPLSNQGGIITLINSQGLKVHGVSYTKEQAQREGWTIAF
jgi:uncharacterized protein YukJ